MSLLKEHVLVLNKYYLAVQVTIAKEAIIALCTGKAQVVDYNYSVYNLDQWHQYTKKANGLISEVYPGVIYSPSIKLFVPMVIRFSNCEYTSPLIKTIKYSRKNLFVRDDYTCQYCNKIFTKKELTLDHVVPKSKGGKNCWTNIVTCCRICNVNKANKSLDDLGWQLLKNPTKPKWNSYTGVSFARIKKEYWEKFLG
jgi:5-methylcytosine-specific restriction endonuclease McrA